MALVSAFLICAALYSLLLAWEHYDAEIPENILSSWCLKLWRLLGCFK